MAQEPEAQKQPAYSPEKAWAAINAYIQQMSPEVSQTKDTDERIYPPEEHPSQEQNPSVSKEALKTSENVDAAKDPVRQPSEYMRLTSRPVSANDATRSGSVAVQEQTEKHTSEQSARMIPVYQAGKWVSVPAETADDDGLSAKGDNRFASGAVSSRLRSVNGTEQVRRPSFLEAEARAASEEDSHRTSSLDAQDDLSAQEVPSADDSGGLLSERDLAKAFSRDNQTEYSRRSSRYTSKLATARRAVASRLEENAKNVPEKTVKSIERMHSRMDERRRHRAETEEERSAKKALRKNAFFDKLPDRWKNPSQLQIRMRTGAIYIGITALCTLLGNIPLVLMLMVTAGWCAGEFYFMLRQDAKLPNEMLGIIAAVLYPPAMYYAGLVGTMLVSLALLLALLVWYVFWLRARIPDVGVSFFGAAYCGLLLSGLVLIRTSIDSPWGGVLVLLIFLSVWANDAFAYLIGSRFGKHKLSPRTSPKKSWEGFAAGVVASMVFWLFTALVPGVAISAPMALLFGFICALMGVLGDLAESRIKRNSGVKDSGTIMPGHGGLLDRCDSTFLVAVSAAILLFGFGCLPYPAFF